AFGSCLALEDACLPLRAFGQGGWPVGGEGFQGNETGALQAALNDVVLHETAPNPLRPVVLDHDDDRALIDAQLVRADPMRFEIEGVSESIGGPERGPVLIIEVAEGGDGNLGSESDGAGNRGRG